MGTAEAGDATKNFGKAAGADTPAAVMGVLDKFLTGMTQPVSWDTAKNTLDQLLRNIAPGVANNSVAEKQIEDRLHHYLNNDGNLDRGGLVRFVADAFNDLSVTQQDPKLVQQASDMLARLGIADNANHSYATGVAKLAAAESQFMQGANPAPAAAAPSTPTPSPYRRP